MCQSSQSRVNVLQTIRKRHQLTLMYYNFVTYQDMYVKYGHSVENDYDVSIHFPLAKEKLSMNNIKTNDFNYKIGTIVTVDVTNTHPVFGEILKIFVIDQMIFIKYCLFKTIGFDKHYHSWTVVKKYWVENLIKYTLLPSRTPCLLFEEEGEKYNATRYQI